MTISQYIMLHTLRMHMRVLKDPIAYIPNCATNTNNINININEEMRSENK